MSREGIERGEGEGIERGEGEGIERGMRVRDWERGG